MRNPGNVRSSPSLPVEQGGYDDFLADESHFLGRCDIKVSRRRLTEALQQIGLGKADAEAVVRDYCDRHGILPQYDSFLGTIFVVVFVLGFGTCFLLLRDALDIMQRIRSPYDPAQILWRLRLEEVNTIFFVTVGTLLVVGTAKMVLSYAQRRRRSVISTARPLPEE